MTARTIMSNDTLDENKLADRGHQRSHFTPNETRPQNNSYSESEPTNSRKRDWQEPKSTNNQNVGTAKRPRFSPGTGLMINIVENPVPTALVTHDTTPERTSVTRSKKLINEVLVWSKEAESKTKRKGKSIKRKPYTPKLKQSRQQQNNQVNKTPNRKRPSSSKSPNAMKIPRRELIQSSQSVSNGESSKSIGTKTVPIQKHQTKDKKPRYRGKKSVPIKGQSDIRVYLTSPKVSSLEHQFEMDLSTLEQPNSSTRAGDSNNPEIEHFPQISRENDEDPVQASQNRASLGTGTSSKSIKKKRKTRCKKCKNCLTPNCGKCSNCK